MKLKINKACDLSSISVLPPPHTRRLSSVQQPGMQPSSSQLRSQPSQQSFSQGFSSQHCMFSQLSQTSLDEAFINDHRLNSQERENTVKKASSVPPPGFSREDGQVPSSRSSVNLMRKWNRGLAGDDKCQISELEHRIGTIETSLNKFAMLLDSVQSDIMQVNKGTKGVLLEVVGNRQKLLVLDTSMNKELGEIKSTFNEGLKSITEQLNKDAVQDRTQEMFHLLSSLPAQMEASLLKVQDKLHATCVQEMQAMISNLKTPNIRSPHLSQLPPKAMISNLKTPNICSPQLSQLPPKEIVRPSNLQSQPETVEIQASIPMKPAQATEIREEDTSGWKSVKREQNTHSKRRQPVEQTRKRVSYTEPAPTRQERGSRISTDSDEEIDGGLSCLIDPKQPGTGNFMVDESKEETERILRRARRRKRKSLCLPIIID